MKSRSHHPNSFGRAFTLIEMLVSIAILSIMLISLASAMAYVTRLFTTSVGAVDNFSKARVILNALDRDIQMMVMRRDLAAFADQTNGPACAFYTQVQGNPGTGVTTPDTRTVSLVQYSLVETPSSAPTNSALERLNCGMNFATAGMTPTVGYNSSYSTNLVQLTNSAVTAIPPENVSSGVVAFRWQFIDGTGTVNTPTSTTPFNFNYIIPNSSANYRTVVISMVVLSNSAYKLAVKTGNLGLLTDGASIFVTSAPTGNMTYSQVWNNFLNSPNSTFLALPASIRTGIQVFERHIPLPITTPTS